jgi:hypothetical protein
MAEVNRVAYLTEVELSTGTILEVKESVDEVELRLRERWANRDAPPELMTLTHRDGRKLKINPHYVVAIVPREGAEPIGFHTPQHQTHR